MRNDDVHCYFISALGILFDSEKGISEKHRDDNIQLAKLKGNYFKPSGMRNNFMSKSEASGQRVNGTTTTRNHCE